MAPTPVFLPGESHGQRTEHPYSLALCQTQRSEQGSGGQDEMPERDACEIISTRHMLHAMCYK